MKLLRKDNEMASKSDVLKVLDSRATSKRKNLEDSHKTKIDKALKELNTFKDGQLSIAHAKLSKCEFNPGKSFQVSLIMPDDSGYRSQYELSVDLSTNTSAIKYTNSYNEAIKNRDDELNEFKAHVRNIRENIMLHGVNNEILAMLNNL